MDENKFKELASKIFFECVLYFHRGGDQEYFVYALEVLLGKMKTELKVAKTESKVEGVKNRFFDPPVIKGGFFGLIR